MTKLLEILNSLIEKYQIEEADVREIQAALAEIESDAESEFSYSDEEEEEVQGVISSLLASQQRDPLSQQIF